MDLDMKKMMEKKWVQYVLYIILIALIYFGFIRKKLYEAFDSDSISSNSGNSSSGKDKIVAVQDAENIANDLKTNSTKIEDSLHLDKYRTQMENLIIDMNDWISAKTAQMLPSIAKQMTDAKESGSIGEVILSIQKLNEFNKFKETLNATMKFIDSK
jgi:hypothetical protein